jgi:hypothetical protein
MEELGNGLKPKDFLTKHTSCDVFTAREVAPGNGIETIVIRPHVSCGSDSESGLSRKEIRRNLLCVNPRTRCLTLGAVGSVRNREIHWVDRYFA